MGDNNKTDSILLLPPAKLMQPASHLSQKSKVTIFEAGNKCLFIRIMRKPPYFYKSISREITHSQKLGNMLSFFSMSKILHPAAFHVCWCSPFDPLAALLSKHSQMILISLDAECRCHPRVGMLVDRPLLNDLKHIVNTGKHLCLCNNCDTSFCKGVFSEYVPFFL